MASRAVNPPLNRSSHSVRKPRSAGVKVSSLSPKAAGKSKLDQRLDVAFQKGMDLRRRCQGHGARHTAVIVATLHGYGEVWSGGAC
jgi:hypothetical protein